MCLWCPKVLSLEFDMKHVCSVTPKQTYISHLYLRLNIKGSWETTAAQVENVFLLLYLQCADVRLHAFRPVITPNHTDCSWHLYSLYIWYYMKASVVFTFLMEPTSKPQSARTPAVLTHAHILRCDLNYKVAVQRYNVTCENARTPGKGATSQERSELE